MLPEERLNEAATQTMHVHEDADLSDEQKAALRNARRRINRIRDQLTADREETDDVEVIK